VATFAHNVARGLPLILHDPASTVALVYVHDVVGALIDAATSPPSPGTAESRLVTPVVDATVGELADLMKSFASSREDLKLPDFSRALVRELYATYLSYLPVDHLAYDLPKHSDARGTLAETVKSSFMGQIFVSRTAPGVTRGNHFHHTKTEKFLVVNGDAAIRFRPAFDPDGQVLEYRISATDFRVVDIPPGLTHSIENVGADELVVLFWASEIFDANHPDTFPLNVL
jgi:UDP-2-acetamido-2,6-beta-L-arabino-hexul-4-ose reductase